MRQALCINDGKLAGEKHPFFGKKRPQHVIDVLRAKQSNVYSIQQQERYTQHLQMQLWHVEDQAQRFLAGYLGIALTQQH